MKADETVLLSQMREKARELSSEQLASLTGCVEWYNSRVWTKPNKADHNPVRVIPMENGYVLQNQKSRHTFSPGEWLHFFYDMYLHAKGDADATARIAQTRDNMNSLRT